MRKTPGYLRDVQIVVMALEDWVTLNPFRQQASPTEVAEFRNITPMRVGLVAHDAIKILRERGWNLEYKDFHGQRTAFVIHAAPRRTTPT